MITVFTLHESRKRVKVGKFKVDLSKTTQRPFSIKISPKPNGGPSKNRSSTASKGEALREQNQARARFDRPRQEAGLKEYKQLRLLLSTPLLSVCVASEQRTKTRQTLGALPACTQVLLRALPKFVHVTRATEVRSQQCAGNQQCSLVEKAESKNHTHK